MRLLKAAASTLPGAGAGNCASISACTTAQQITSADSTPQQVAGMLKAVKNEQSLLTHAHVPMNLCQLRFQSTAAVNVCKGLN